MTNIAVTWTLTVFVLAVIGYMTRYSETFPRSLMAIWFALAPSLVGLGRMCLRIIQRGLLQRGVGVRRVAIAGLNDLGRQTSANIIDQPSLGLRMVGYFDDREAHRAEDEQQEILEGDLNDLVVQAQQGEIDTILITLPMRAEDRIKYLLDQLSNSTASVYIVPDFFVFELLHSRWTSMGGLPAVSVFENPLFGVDGLLKRIADLALAFLALIAAAIPMCLIAVAVKLSSPGPIFFRQRRYGLDGREIMVWKFRSMQTCDNGPVVKQATKGDPRITAVGEILRKDKFGRAPTVVQRDRGHHVARRTAASRQRSQRTVPQSDSRLHASSQGQTGHHRIGPGQRMSRETETIDKMERRIDWDHQYIRSWSLWLDIKIMLKTLIVVWRQEEAY